MRRNVLFCHWINDPRMALAVAGDVDSKSSDGDNQRHQRYRGHTKICVKVSVFLVIRYIIWSDKEFFQSFDMISDFGYIFDSLLADWYLREYFEAKKSIFKQFLWASF